MNKVIWLLVISDVLILSAFGLISPIFAIFLTTGIVGGSIVAAGTASTIFFLVKSITQLPLSMYLDKKRSKLGFLWVGTFLVVLVPVIYAFSPSVKVVFFAQVIYAIGAAMSYPAWFSLFTMHLDRKHRSLEWSVWSTSVGIGTAIAAYLGALAVNVWSFKTLFFIVAGISLLGMISLLFLSNRFLKDMEDGVNLVRLKHQKN